MKRFLLSLFLILCFILSANATEIKKIPYKNLKNGKYILPANSDYNFIYKNTLIGYSNSTMKFYEYSIEDINSYPRELNEFEVQKIFGDYRVIKLSEFSKTTNSIRLRKSGGKFILLNDTDRTFDAYEFYSNNAKYNIYPLRGFLQVKKGGMIQFSQSDKNTVQTPWFVLLIR